MPATARSSTCSARDEQKERFLRPLVEGDIALVLLHDRAGGVGLGPDAAADARRARRRRMGDRRPQVVLVGRRGRRLRDRHGRHRPGRASRTGARSQILVPADTPGVEVVRAGAGAGPRGRGWTTHCEVRYDGRARAGREHARRARRRLPDRAEAPRPGPDPPRDALARPDAARLRADVLATRSSARRSAGRSPRSRRCRTGSPIRPPRSRPAG